ncbi:zinc ribbon domain-containing protein [Allochromatium humboldtianum]
MVEFGGRGRPRASAPRRSQRRAGHRVITAVPLNERRKHAYVCTRCGHQAHADVNAAQNVRDRYGLCCPVVLKAPLGGPHDPAPKRVREITAKAVM